MRFRPPYKVLRVLTALLTGTRDLITLLKLTRFPTLMVISGAAVLVYVDQGQDSLRALVEWGDSFRLEDGVRIALVFLATLAWGFSAWYFSRVMLMIRFRNTPRAPWLIAHVPRVLGTAAFLSMAVGMWRASAPTLDETQWLLRALAVFWLICAVAFYWILLMRRELLRNVHGKLKKTRVPEWILRLLEIEATPRAKYRSWGGLPPVTKRLTAGFAGLAVVLGGAFTVWPLAIAPLFGTIAIVLLAMAGWIPLGSRLVYLGNRRQFPALTALFLLAIGFSFFNDNHRIRVLEDTEVVSGDFESVEASFKSWLGKRRRDAPERHQHPLFLVAAEGGGIRAAYWTATILSLIQDQSPSFSDHLFAISGVSGGSLGGAVFTALLTEKAENGQPPCGQSFLQCSKQMVSRDFLSPILAIALYPDLLQRFLPFAVPYFDRGRAMEMGWEAGWRETVGGGHFEEPFRDLWRGTTGIHVPSLVLNATSVETGKRYLTSNLLVDKRIFSDAVGLEKLLERELSLSTAVHNSARFPYISPAGTIVDDSGRLVGHVVDGGYLDNSGVPAVQDMLSVLAKLDGWQSVLPVLIVISNQPLKGPTTDVLPFFQETLSPLMALLNARVARGSLSMNTIEAEAGRQQWRYFRFALCDRDEGEEAQPLPLGWQLSESAQRAMDEQLEHGCALSDNPRHLLEIVSLLGGS